MQISIYNTTYQWIQETRQRKQQSNTNKSKKIQNLEKGATDPETIEAKPNKWNGKKAVNGDWDWNRTLPRWRESWRSDCEEISSPERYFQNEGFFSALLSSFIYIGASATRATRITSVCGRHD